MSLIKKVSTTRGLGSRPGADAAAAGGAAEPADATKNLDPITLPDGTKGLPTLPPPPPAAPQHTSHMAPVMQPGVVLQGRYAIEGTIGVGGMSVVYRGRDLRFKDVVRPCAIKEMYQSAPDSDTRLLNLKNFERESGLLATLQHSAIPKVYDFFEENGRIYLILELIPGKDLETVLSEAGGPLPEERVARWAVQICDVLSYLHGRSPEALVFRDMKPSNVMVTADDRVVLIDFGIARDIVKTKGTMIGTEGYSPPEQYRGIAEPRSDIYALGATLHHLLTAADPQSEPPFTFGERPIRLLNPSISREMETVVSKALDYKEANRYASAADLRDALLRTPTLGGAAQGAAPSSTPSSTPQPAARQAPRQSASATAASLLWKFRCEEEVRSSPHLHAGMLYIGCYDTNLYALDSGTGQFRWKYATQGGISSSPMTWGEMVYVGSEDGAVYALDHRRGMLRWSFQTAKPVRSSPRIVDRVVFFGSDDQQFYAIDGLRGTQIWSYRTWMPIRSSAYVSQNTVYFGGGDGYVYALQLKNGGIRWKQRTQQPVISSPVVADGVVYVGSMDSTLYALDGDGGFPIWKFRTNHYVNSTPCVQDGSVYFGGVDGNLYALDVRTGRQQWKLEIGSQITSSPKCEAGRVYVGAVDGAVYCVDAATGAQLWRFQTDGPVVSSPAVDGGVVYIGSMDHTVYALRA